VEGMFSRRREKAAPKSDKGFGKRILFYLVLYEKICHRHLAPPASRDLATAHGAALYNGSGQGLQGKHLAPCLWSGGDAVGVGVPQQLIHRVFAHDIRGQVANLGVPLQTCDASAPRKKPDDPRLYIEVIENPLGGLAALPDGSDNQI